MDKLESIKLNLPSDILQSNYNMSDSKKFSEFKEKLNIKLDDLSGKIKNKTNSDSILENLEHEIFYCLENACSNYEYNMTNINTSDKIVPRKKLEATNNKLSSLKRISFLKSIVHNHGGVWFHPRELINQEILLTSGKDGIIKIWDIKNSSFQLINKIETGANWISSIKYDKKSSKIFCSTYSEYIFIYEYELKENKITLILKLKTQLNFIYGFDFINNDNTTLFACSGDSEHLEKVFLYNYKDTPTLLQSFIPLRYFEDLPENKKCENYSKSLKFCENLNLLIVGLYNGIIEVYKISTQTFLATFIYYIKLSLPDWIYQIQICSFLNRNIILASNGNFLYQISFSLKKFKILRRKNFISSIYDFSYFTYNKSNGLTHNKYEEMVFDEDCIQYILLKMKPGMILLYDLTNDKILEEVDETYNKSSSLYNNCMIFCSKEKLVISCSDKDIIVYNVNM